MSSKIGDVSLGYLNISPFPFVIWFGPIPQGTTPLMWCVGFNLGELLSGTSGIHTSHWISKEKR